MPVLLDADIRFVQGDPASVQREMVKVAGDQNNWLVGGGELVGEFAYLTYRVTKS